MRSSGSAATRRPQPGAKAPASVTPGTPSVGSSNIPVATGVSARATSAFASRMSWSVAVRPSAANILRRVLRWSMAMIANVPRSPARASRVCELLVVASAMNGFSSWVERVGGLEGSTGEVEPADEGDEVSSAAVRGVRGEQRGAGGAGLRDLAEGDFRDGAAPRRSDAVQSGPTAGREGCGVRADDPVDGLGPAGRIDCDPGERGLPDVGR